MKKKMPVNLDPDVDDFCYLLAQVIIPLLGIEVDNHIKKASDSEDAQKDCTLLKPSRSGN